MFRRYRVGDLYRKSIGIGALGVRAGRVISESFISSRSVTVIGALMNDIDGFPRVQTDVGNDQMVVRRIVRIDVPAQSVRIPETTPRFLRAPAVAVNGLSFELIASVTLTVLVAACSWRSGMIRRIFPTIVSSRCGLSRTLLFCCSPDPPSPQPI